MLGVPRPPHPRTHPPILQLLTVLGKELPASAVVWPPWVPVVSGGSPVPAVPRRDTQRRQSLPRNPNRCAPGLYQDHPAHFLSPPAMWFGMLRFCHIPTLWGGGAYKQPPSPSYFGYPSGFLQDESGSCALFKAYPVRISVLEAEWCCAPLVWTSRLRAGLHVRPAGACRGVDTKGQCSAA